MALEVHHFASAEEIQHNEAVGLRAIPEEALERCFQQMAGLLEQVCMYNMVMSPVGHGTKSHCAGEDRQEFSMRSVEADLVSFLIYIFTKNV
jgi:hypothetical protein